MKDLRKHERHVLGCLLTRNELYDELGISLFNFTDAKNRRIFQAIEQLVADGKEADELSVFDWLESNNIDVPVSVIAELKDSVASTANVGYYVGLIKENTYLRRLDTLSREIQDMLKQSEAGENIMEHIEQRLTTITDSGQDSELHKVKDLIKPALDSLDESVKHKGQLIGISTGYKQIDITMGGGLRDEELTIIASRTSVGKTAIALNMAARMAFKNGVKVVFFSCEMSKELVVERLIAITGRVHLLKIRSGTLQPADFGQITEAASEINEAALWISDTPNIKLLKLKSLMRKAKRTENVDIFFVDYLTLIKHGTLKQTMYERVGEISKELKSMARELHVPIVAMSQLNRLAEGKLPTLETIRQSGEIEEDTDVIMLLHRKTREDSETKLMVAKNRNGPCGSIDLVFESQYTRFEEKEIWDEV